MIPIALVLSATSPVGGVVVWEALVLPDSKGWVRNPFCDPARWLEDGWFFQHVHSCPPYPPPGGQQESYERSLAPFEGELEFFIEWEMESDGARSEITGTAPASLVAFGRSGVTYHFTIARDQVRFVRDNLLPILYIDIDPEVPHTYRLELYDDQLYIWYIDGEVIDEGLPEGPFPKSDSRLKFRAKSWYLESTTKWDYIRYGTIPQEASGDFDSDEDVDLRDYYYVHECLSNSGPDVDAGPGCRFADFDADTDVDLQDLAEFQNRFSGEDG